MSSLDELNPISATRSTLTAVVCGVFLALADALAWLVVYQAVAPSSQMGAIKFTVMAAAWCAWAALVRKQYTRRNSFWTEYGLILQGVAMLVVLGSVLKVLIGNADSIFAWLTACLLLAFVLPLFRWCARAGLNRFGFWGWPTLLFGSSENAINAVLALRGEPAMGYVVAGLVLPRDAAATPELQALKCSFFNWPEDAHDFAQLRGYHCVIALEAREFSMRDRLLRQLSQHQVNHVHVIPAMRGVPLFGLATTNFFSQEVLMIHVRNNLMNPIQRSIKRLFDVIGASFLIVLLSPLMIWVAYKIWRTDGAPVFFSQQRVGKGLKNFEFYKFRSMVQNAEEMLKSWESTGSPEWQEYTANNFKLVNDPRLINIGAMIRRTSIDELPQLFNVIKGDMSLVGPRPLLPREKSDYGEELPLYGNAVPGLTGLWQVSGRSRTTFDDRISFDTWYVRNWSIWLDIVILFKTMTVVCRRNGAY